MESTLDHQGSPRLFKLGDCGFESPSKPEIVGSSSISRAAEFQSLPKERSQKTWAQVPTEVSLGSGLSLKCTVSLLLQPSHLATLEHALHNRSVTKAYGNEPFQLGRSNSDEVRSPLVSSDPPIQGDKNKPLGTSLAFQ